MPSTETVATVQKDFSPKVKFALTLGATITVGILGAAATVVVGVLTAKATTALEEAIVN